MNAEGFALRRAAPADAGTIAAIVTEVADGLVEEFLGGIKPALGGSDILALVFGRGEGVYHTENVVLAENNGEILGLLFAYPSARQEVPDLARHYLPSARLRRLGDILTASVPETLWINTLWVAENSRNLGLGGCLLEVAEDWAEQKALKGVSLYAWAAARKALAFYEHSGFSVAREVPAADPPVQGQGGPHSQGGFILAKFRNNSK